MIISQKKDTLIIPKAKSKRLSNKAIINTAPKTFLLNTNLTPLINNIYRKMYGE